MQYERKLKKKKYFKTSVDIEPAHFTVSLSVSLCYLDWSVWSLKAGYRQMMDALNAHNCLGAIQLSFHFLFESETHHWVQVIRLLLCVNASESIKSSGNEGSEVFIYVCRKRDNMVNAVHCDISFK